MITNNPLSPRQFAPQKAEASPPTSSPSASSSPPATTAAAKEYTDCRLQVRAASFFTFCLRIQRRACICMILDMLITKIKLEYSVFIHLGGHNEVKVKMDVILHSFFPSMLLVVLKFKIFVITFLQVSVHNLLQNQNC